MSSPETMAKHALAILDQNDLWDPHSTQRIKASGDPGGRFYAVASKLLRCLIEESHKFDGKVLERFWYELGACDERLQDNIKHLRAENFVSAQRSYAVLFRGLDPRAVNFDPVLTMAAQFFTHLCIAFMNPGERKSGTSTDCSASQSVDERVDVLLATVNEDRRFGTRTQEALKKLSFKRDGQSCLLTHWKFKPFKPNGFVPALTHIVPNSIHGKSETLKCIAMFAGRDVADEVAKNLNAIGNVMNMEQNVHMSYDALDWGIEAEEEGGKVKYLFRAIFGPTGSVSLTPENIVLKDGDEIQFGKGPHAEMLGNGPTPKLCNLRLAVARVLKRSTAADIILEWKDNADDEGSSRLFIASEEYFNVLDHKLLLSGRAEIIT